MYQAVKERDHEKLKELLDAGAGVLYHDAVSSAHGVDDDHACRTAGPCLPTHRSRTGSQRPPASIRVPTKSFTPPSPPQVGMLPVHLAADNSDRVAMGMLIAKGAKVNYANGMVRRQKHLLLTAPISPCLCLTPGLAPQGCTPLHYASGKGAASVVEELIEAGAAINPKSNVRIAAQLPKQQSPPRPAPFVLHTAA